VARLAHEGAVPPIERAVAAADGAREG
jgi:hypothetical protein